MTLRSLREQQIKLVILSQGSCLLALESRLVVGCRRRLTDDHPEKPHIKLDLLADAIDDNPHPLLFEFKQGGNADTGLWSGTADLTEIPATAIHPLPTAMAARKTWPFLKALVNWQNHIIPLLDVKLLTIESSVNEKTPS